MWNSGRIYLCPSNEYSGLEVEFMRTFSGVRMYINVFGLEIPPNGDDLSTSQVYVSFKDYSYTFTAQRFTGGQRLLVPEETMEEIIECLTRGQPVFLRVGRYEGDIYPEQFSEIFTRLMSK